MAGPKKRKNRGEDGESSGSYLISNRMVREINGFVLLAVSIFLAISLISYYHGDPSYNRVAPGVLTTNWGGIIGAYASDFLLVFLGIGAYLLTLYIFVLSLHFLVSDGIKNIFLRSLYSLFIFFSIMVLLGAVFGQNKILYGRTVYAGGILGIYLASFLWKYISVAGTAILSLLVLVLSSILILGKTVREALVFASVFSSRLFKGLKTIFALLADGVICMSRIRGKKKGSVKSPPKLKGEVRATLPPEIVEVRPLERVRRDISPERQPRFDFGRGSGEYVFPPLDLLKLPENESSVADKKSLIMKARILEKKLLDFSVRGKVTEVRPGPVVTMFEFEPAPGERINKIAGLADDIAMAMSALSVRIIAPIAGKSVVGFEIPNPTRDTVSLREIIGCDDFDASKSKLTFALGKDIFGAPVTADLMKMPHLLIAGATGSGKSVCINSIILSILYKASPEDVKFLLIDPKMLELSLYRGIAHLLLPVITDSKEASVALRWAVEEMEQRYRVMAELGVKNITGYNRKVAEMKPVSTDTMEGDREPHRKIPLIVLIIDELADLMMTSTREVEESITRLAHMARASGIHLIVATQRPSVNVLTGVIKANFPARISFQVSSRVDSRTILDVSGAEHLLGMGDMLFLPPTTSNLIRVHGANVSEDEIIGVVEFIKEQGSPTYMEVDLKARDETHLELDDGYDEKYDDAVALVAETRKASISMIQRHLRIGYNRAARIIEKMEEDGIIGPSDGVKPREVLINKI
ncbi:MAG: DNA translocase FtsK 4TM domain-containing protein [Deltaproteobacteria bacterium]|uniref:DNA translocase FtsK 4TM domain-containing protein n=1 Tax=Candidatus Zymogenus saltonus TaxID=2844893 RepID=A0A9D8PNZ6_9DELT|nr:DNA translocase FtsK 4TM domain-containing protein [Candidatus Zymogenus saltonus]